MFRNFCKAIKIFRSIKQSNICLVLQKKNTERHSIYNIVCDAIFMKLANSLLKPFIDALCKREQFFAEFKTVSRILYFFMLIHSRCCFF